MNTLYIAILLFTDFLKYLIFLDVILSWLTLAGFNLRPKFLADLIDPMYKFARKYIPTRFGMFDFTPIILLFVILFIQALVLANVPGIGEIYKQLFSF